jgi:hypothetical protein
MASATKGCGSRGRADIGLSPSRLGSGESESSIPLPVSKHERQQARMMLRMALRLRCISPCRSASSFGIRPGFLTMYAINSAGSPPMLKNSSPCSSINRWKIGCVATRIRWPNFRNVKPRDTNGWTSPLEPTT